MENWKKWIWSDVDMDMYTYLHGQFQNTLLPVIFHAYLSIKMTHNSMWVVGKGKY